jgi:CRAL/TRIO domain
MTYETLLQDPENQVLGFTHIGDFAGLSQKHISCWEPTDFLRTLKWGEQSIPMRHKVIHIVNVSTTVKWVLDLAKTRVSDKIRERIKIHLNVDDLKKEMEDVSCLPKEMGGIIPAAEMIELWKRELAAKRDVVVALDKMKILNDRQIIGRHTKLDEDAVTGSFRKLNFD